jgi:hypothetical protein
MIETDAETVNEIDAETVNEVDAEQCKKFVKFE